MALRTLLPSLFGTLPLVPLLLLCNPPPLSASTSRPDVPIEMGSTESAKLRSVGRRALDESLLNAMHPRCELELVGSSFAAGDKVLASWRILNPAPTRVKVEIKIWFTAPGQAPYSISNILDSGKPVSLPASLDEQTGLTELFAVDEQTIRGIYEISCRLINPVTGSMYSEDLNDFQIQ